MSKYDNYGGVNHDATLDTGDVFDWNPVDHIGSIDDADWEESYDDPTGWSEASVQARVWRVDIPAHDDEGNVEGEPYMLPPQYIGATHVYVAGCYWDWEHACGGINEACPVGATLDQAQTAARNACDGPMEAAGCLLTPDIWLKGNPEFEIDDSDPENKVVRLQYWTDGEISPYVSEDIYFDEDPASAVWEYVCRMGWDEAPPNHPPIDK